MASGPQGQSPPLRFERRIPGHLGHKLTPGSEIVINRAVRQCALEGIWVVTIHDCLVTYPEHAERVRQIMVEAFESVGLTPTIKVTAFNQEAQEARRGDPGVWVD
jgi:hypothetical protein